jgi:protein phosphatase-4 regulatory subunit 3
MKMINQTKQNNPEAERFIMYFYSDCADTLFKPLEDIPEFKTHKCKVPPSCNLKIIFLPVDADPVLQLSREKTNLYLYLCDLLTAAAQQHKVEGHNFIHRSSCATRLATLLRARDKHLRLAALRFFRMLIKMDKGLYFDYLRRHGVVGPILELTTQESRRDNVLSASCHELFEHMRKVQLCVHRG